MKPTSDRPALNPFSTRFVRPGAMRYLFAGDESAEKLVRRLDDTSWHGQIVGPHGSGKSTLLASLIEPLRAAGREPWLCTLHDRQRRMPRGWVGDARASGAALIVIDGYEQLSYFNRVLVRAACRLHGWGLLVTAHRDVGLPTLTRTSSSVAAARAIVAQLAGSLGTPIDAGAIETDFHAADGNLREMLFLLYDRYERAQRA